MRWTAVVLLPLALLVVACGPGRESPAGAEPTIADMSPSDVTTEVAGGTPLQQRILREVLAGLGTNELEEVEIAEPGPWGTGGPGSVALIVPHAEGDLRREWLSWLLAQAFAQRSQELGLPQVSDVAGDRAGDRATNLGSVSNFGRQATAALARRAAESAADAARRSGAEVRRMEILGPYDYGFAVELKVRGDSAKFLRDGLPEVLAAIGGPEPMESPFAGDHTLVLDEEENLVWEGAEAKLGDGSIQVGGATRWELQGCGPYFIGGPPGRKPPPCPVDSDEHSSESVQIETVPPSKVTAKIIGGTPKQRTIIEEALAGLGPTRIDSVQVYDKIDQAWAGATPDSVGIDIRSSKPDEFTRWQAWQVANAFGRRSSLLGLQPIGFVGINGDRAGGLDWSEDLADAPVTRAEAEKALRRVAEIAARHDASTSVRIFQLDRLAFAIEFVTAKPAEFLLHGFEPALAPTDAPNNDGRHVEVLDAKGGQILNGGWVRPDLLDCSPFVRFGGPLRPEPPPCPAK
jgi:hypothetical protein